MLIDKLNEFCNSAAVTSSTMLGGLDHQGGVSYFGDKYKGQDAVGNELDCVVICNEAATAASAGATVQFELKTADSAAVTSGTVTALTNGVVVYSGAAIAKTACKAGAELCRFRLPKGLKRYTGLYITVANGPLTAGKFSGFLTFDK